MSNISNIPDHQKAEFMRYLEDQQMKDSLKMYNYLVENCFEKCVAVGWNGSFSSKQLDDTEAKCIGNCAEKFMKVTQRAGFRFAEYQAQQGAQAQQQR